MTKEDILQALRLTAMGRYGHDLQVQLAEELAALTTQPVCMDDCGRVEPDTAPKAEAAYFNVPMGSMGEPVEVVAAPVKRGPGRPKKAE
jgi:hypothetical protein